MPVHDWTRVDAGISHTFHHGWITAIGDVLNAGLLPPDYYALPEQRGAGFTPDVLTLERRGIDGVAAGRSDDPRGEGGGGGPGGALLQLAPPRIEPTDDAEIDFYRRKQNALVVRHVSGDRMVGVIEIVSPGNKSGRTAFSQFVEKTSALVMGGVHLLILDLFPPSARDPLGLHAAVWEDVASRPYRPPADKPLAAIAYEAADGVRAYVRHMAVGDPVPDVPLFLAWNACINPPLETTYQTAFSKMPVRWRRVLEQPG